MEQPILIFDRICKAFFGARALKDVTLKIEKGRVLGLIGENGAGKTTLMNILGGVVQADEGRMFFNNVEYKPHKPSDATDAGIAFIHQELNLFNNLSIADNIHLTGFPRYARSPFINRTVLHDRTRELLDLVDLNISPGTAVEKLQPGERQLVEVAKALGSGAEIFIFDEPTTSLTLRETERLFSILARLKEDGKTIIYISHILADILKLADSIAILRDGEMVGEGDIEDYTVNRLIALMVGRDLDHLYPPRISRPGDKPVLRVKNLSSYGMVADIGFSLHEGEILGLFGLMGSGRTELARILFGQDPFDRGEITVNSKRVKSFSPVESIGLGMAFVTENRREEGLLMDSSLAENMGLVSLPKFVRSPVWRSLDRTKLNEAIQHLIDTLKIKNVDFENQPVKNLSGGNQQKAVIGKWLLSQPSVFLMDEPTRGIDVGSKHGIYSIMNDMATRGTGILFVSSELEELMGICDRILVMSNGQIQGCFSRSDFDKEQILRMAFCEQYQSGGSQKHV